MENLTPKEYKIAKLRIQGLSTAEIIAICLVSEQTVKNQLNAIFRKLGIKTRGSGKWQHIAELKLAMGRYDRKRDFTDYTPSKEPSPIVFTKEEMRT